MRSRTDCIISKSQVQQWAEGWLSAAFQWKYEGRKCTAAVIYQVLLLAASRVVSIFAALRDLADAPCDQTVRDVLGELLPPMAELERRANRALVSQLPKAFRRRSWRIAIDLTLIPYHGEPLHNEKELVHSKPKSGTTKFHAYATAVVVHQGLRYTLALTHVERKEPMKDVVQRLLATVRKRGVKVRFLLLDKGFFSVAVISYLKRVRQKFIIPVVIRGRKPKGRKPPTGLRALLQKSDGRYRHTLTGQRVKGKQPKTDVTICISTKRYTYEKTGERLQKKLLFAVHKVAGQPDEIREAYRKRFGIETSYRQMNEGRIRTCTRCPRMRLLFVAVALVLRNVWVWIHFQFAREKHSEEPQVILELLRFSELLLWIEQTIQTLLGAHKTKGLDLETFTRVMERAGK
jgi:hypothetical protein